MATYDQTVRRGLPRQPGGDPWPPAAALPVESVLLPAESADVSVGAVVLPAAVTAESAGGLPTTEILAPSVERVGADGRPTAPTSPAAAGGARRIRRGLPRVPGGEPWPAAGAVAAASVIASATAAPAEAAVLPTAVDTAPTTPDAAPAATETVTAPVAATVDGVRPLRRGLPRVAGGEPWPPAGFAPAPAATDLAADTPTEVAAPAASAPEIRQEVTPTTAPAAASGVVATDVSVPLPFTRTVWAGQAARTRPEPKPEPTRIGRFTKAEWAGIVIVGGAGLLFAAGMAVLAVRFLLSTEPFQAFLEAYPGEYELPEGAPVGIPPWLGWQHFFNTFLMVLIIRTGWQVRTEKRPSVFWSPRGNARRKISLNLWFHQSLDILWITNGVIFIVLLFVTGQWMKLVPTSWAVFPNAVSAALQYVSLDWPTENGWVNYNSLQQLAYFTTVFIAAPLAIATGVRMSGIWPKNAKALNKAYPVEWARAIHFPVMLYFVAFIVVHVALVLATGALRNLNHMYASQDAVNWVGFWIFAASLVVIVIGWIAARPLVLAPIAKLFGSVSGR
jgi:thiosulfate reductase cytochrome b subunit